MQHEPKDAYDLILNAIDVGVYRPGDRLVESELADRVCHARLCAKPCSGWKHKRC